MKNHPVCVMGLTLACLLSVSIAHAASHENCVTGLQGLKLNAEVNSQIASFGGLEAIIGKWKMKGLLGTIAKTNVEFQVKEDSFYVAINKDSLKQVILCLGDTAQILKVKILKPKFPKNEIILLKAGNGENVQIAANSSGWRYLKFKKVSDKSSRSKAASFIASEH